MEIQLYKALIEAGIKADTAQNVVESLESEIKRQSEQSAKNLATRQDLTELKFDILKWVVGLALAQMALTLSLILKIH